MKKLFFALAFVLLVTVFSAGIYSRADFGDYAGDNDYDYGGYDSYDYDYDYDDDYDYNDDNYGYGGTYYGEGYSGPHASDAESIGTLAIVVIIVIIILLVVSRRGKGSSFSAPKNKVPTSPGRPVGNSYGRSGMGEKVTARSSSGALRPVPEYKTLDPSFDENALCERMSNLYMQLQNCWTAKNIEPLRPYLTDNLYNMSDRQLEALRQAGRTNYVERIAVLSCTVRGFNQSGDNDFMHIRLRTRIVDYTTDENGNVVSGSKTAEKFMEYEWTLMRKTGIITAEKSGVRTVSCPHCGAPVDINASARCEYCDSVITVDNEDWVISAIEGISQTTR